MLDVINSDYVRTARAKGLPERLVIMRHVVRNALIPIVTVSALSFGGAARRRDRHRDDLHPRRHGLLLHHQARAARHLRGHGVSHGGRRSRSSSSTSSPTSSTASSTRGSAMTEPTARLEAPPRVVDGVIGAARAGRRRGRRGPRAQGPQPVVVRAAPLPPSPAGDDRPRRARHHLRRRRARAVGRAVHVRPDRPHQRAPRADDGRPPLLRHGRDRARLPQPRHLRHPHVRAGRSRRRGRIDPVRPDHGRDRRLLPRLGRQPHHAHHRPLPHHSRCS